MLIYSVFGYWAIGSVFIFTTRNLSIIANEDAPTWFTRWKWKAHGQHRNEAIRRYAVAKCTERKHIQCPLARCSETVVQCVLSISIWIRQHSTPLCTQTLYANHRINYNCLWELNSAFRRGRVLSDFIHSIWLFQHTPESLVFIPRYDY